MQSVSWQIEIARLAGGIQVCQGESDSVQLVGGYPAGVVALIEPPQPSMAKRTDRQLLDALSRTPFVDSTEIALILGEPPAPAHRVLTDLLAEGIVGRVSHGTAHLPSSQRYHLSNAPGDTPLETLAYVGGSRWRIEAEVETEKSDAGLETREANRGRPIDSLDKNLPAKSSQFGTLRPT